MMQIELIWFRIGSSDRLLQNIDKCEFVAHESKKYAEPFFCLYLLNYFVEFGCFIHVVLYKNHM
jgi:hypothetical protein